MRYEIEKRELFLGKDFDKEAFAREMGVSFRKMSKIFSLYAGMTLTDYLHGLRLSRALSLLRENPNWTMDAVAERSGLSLRTFHRRFAQKFGITPQAYQKQALQSPDHDDSPRDAAPGEQ